MTKGKASAELTQRAHQVLHLLVLEYIRTGVPVGSKRLASLHQEGISPATIRAIMARLEQAGFLNQPHTSAGRVPTTKGFQFYIDGLERTPDPPHRQVARIRQMLEQETDPGDLMVQTSQILSRLSNNLGFVLAPPQSVSFLKRIEFVKISSRRILAILVTRAGLVQSRLIASSRDLNQEDLDRAGLFFQEEFKGQTLSHIRRELRRLQTCSRREARPRNDAIRLGSASLFRSRRNPGSDSEVYFGGTSRLLQQPELTDQDRAAGLFRTMERKSRLAKVLTERLDADQPAPRVTLDLDRHIPEMRGWAMISSPYLYRERVAGSLGILGPRRMKYDKGISLVGYVARLFGQILSAT
jgi:heat-inducible transcriptional repressor